MVLEWAQRCENKLRSRLPSADIPGAVYLDIDKVADTTHPVAHMLPTPQFFAESIAKVGKPVQNKYLLLLPLPAQFLIVSYRYSHCLQLGVSSGDDVVVYDTQGIFASPRYVCGQVHLLVILVPLMPSPPCCLAGRGGCFGYVRGTGCIVIFMARHFASSQFVRSA
jgi:hypothetical protein